MTDDVQQEPLTNLKASMLAECRPGFRGPQARARGSSHGLRGHRHGRGSCQEGPEDGRARAKASLCFYISIDRSICLPIYLSTYLPIYIYLSTYLYLPIYLSIDLSIYVPIYVPIYILSYLSIYLSVYLSIYLSI